jgi:hypothetical protein
MRYALINIKSGIVENVIELEDLTEWPTPDGYQIAESDTAGPGWSFKSGVFTEPASSVQDLTLVDAIASKLAEIDAACAALITSGFTSSALDANVIYTYPSKITDQANLTSSVLASLIPGIAADWSTPFWCADPSGVWSYRMHTAAQIQKVGVDAKSVISSCIQRKITIEAQISSLTDAASVQAISWSSPI